MSNEKERLVHNALLNYLSRALQANKTDEICEKAVGFYDKDTIIKAKDTLWHYSNTSSRNAARQKIADNVLDMLKLIQLCETNRIKLPKIVIFDPTEVPTTPDELSAIVTQKTHAPANDADNTLKDEFYENLQFLIDSIPLHDVTCIAADLNAKVDHRLGTIHENGTRFVSFAMGNDLLIGGTLNQHRGIHKYTWISPDSTGNRLKIGLALELKDVSYLSIEAKQLFVLAMFN
ncbi:hypothetical protein QYM36_001495 [Artemia franciscana]|uniref:Uncharacterized protein n=1 Tax=Artemia franciscana TaxID=6661 RepID=A0AA88IQW0_ARTSF|nr:hypothetical protein QYM36_001495 [Artemia franciscana]